MAPNLLGGTALFLTEATTNDETPDFVPTPTPFTNKSPITSPIVPPISHSAVVPTKSNDRELVFVWRNVLAFIYLHTAALYGMYLMFTCSKPATNWFSLIYGLIAGMGITAGAHRLWAHRAYKANLPLRIFLMLLQTTAFQNHIYEWVRDHRVHHKFTDTDADPHNSNRGFFFSHIGWLMVKKHRDVLIKGKVVDMSDLEKDPVVIWQKKLYLILMPTLCFFLPTWIPYYYWNEDPYVSWYVCAIFRYTISLNATWLVNSAAHIWGTKPYDKSISPTNNIGVAIAAFGEGWHNYHHVFPWDYKAAELGNYRLNLTTAFIDFFSKFGWAYDLKTVPIDMVVKRLKRTGDGSHVNAHGELTVKPEIDYQPIDKNSNHHHHHHHIENQIWGWGDKDMEDEDVHDAEIFNPDKTE